MTLKDLLNPDGWTGILLKNDDFILLHDDQGFQFLPHWVELWQMLADGRLLQVKRWRRSSVNGYYN